MNAPQNGAELDAEVKIRITHKTKAALGKMARNEGLKLSDIARRAIREYLDSRDPEKSRAARIKSESDEEI